jgi:hypothetical protein
LEVSSIESQPWENPEGVKFTPYISLNKLEDHNSYKYTKV